MYLDGVDTSTNYINNDSAILFILQNDTSIKLMMTSAGGGQVVGDVKQETYDCKFPLSNNNLELFRFPARLKRSKL